MRVTNWKSLVRKDVSHKFIYFKLVSYLKAHIFVPFHYFVQVFLPRKYNVVSSLALDYITLLYIVNELPLCSQCLFVTICSQWCFQTTTKSLFKIIMKKKGGLRIKFGKTIHRKTGLTRPQKDFWSALKIVAPWIEKKGLVDLGQ